MIRARDTGLCYQESHLADGLTAGTRFCFFLHFWESTYWGGEPEQVRGGGNFFHPFLHLVLEGINYSQIILIMELRSFVNVVTVSTTMENVMCLNE
jgi:hypothetical protein